ncbi:ubiquitin carrier protein [Blastomyces dermatitidis ATCC 18188]|uniref:Ubiquitin carrier protein n=1 Tax=Ajellomyces dermatitidis (strain ATCC 18188 / CBS 674.68) TaxID=653446 RepID=F2TT21_AJEDA|nr:ubiquitin carrier protein [Blastomyces dermatitidis ATCC 18188]
MASSFRRLASDHASLHRGGLPPHYLFPPSSTSSSFSDDLTQLTVLLTGPQGTPYSQGLWQLHLRIPEDYPKNPPKVAFKTRIWHPNVDESTGAVCVDTLKRDWEAKLTLRDVLITISCLLIHPNPDSALNSAAGSLLRDDYEAFARQAKLMTSIHAPIPKDIKDAVMEAKRRGDESGIVITEDEDRLAAAIGSRKTASTSSVSTVIMKKPVTQRKQSSLRTEKLDIRVKQTCQHGLLSSLQSSSSPFMQDQQQQPHEDESDNEDTGSPSKENDPSLSLSLVAISPCSSRKGVLGKRPLAVLASPSEPEFVLVNSGAAADDDDDDMNNAHSRSNSNDDGLTPSERNIAANALAREQQEQQQQQIRTQQLELPPRKSLKLSVLSRGVNASGRIREDYRDPVSTLAHNNNSNKESRGNGGKQVDRAGSSQSSILSLSPPSPSPTPQPLLQPPNEKPSDDGKENEASTASTIIIPTAASTTTTTTTTPTTPTTTTTTTTTANNKSQQQNQKQKSPPPPPPPPPPFPSSISVPKSSNTNGNNKSNNNINNINNNITARRVSSAPAKAKPRVGLRRL